jgi:hypothetical protein
MKRIILVLALVLLIALPVFAQEVTVDDLNSRLNKLEMWKFGGVYINWMYVSIPSSGFVWDSDGFYVPTDGDAIQLALILPRFTAQYTNGNFRAYFRLNASTLDGSFPGIAWDRWYVQYNFGFMTLQVGKFTVGDTLQPEMFYTFWDSGANIKDFSSNGSNGFGFHIPVGPATIHMVIPSNLNWTSGSELINIHSWVDGTVAEMLTFLVGFDYYWKEASSIKDTSIWAGVSVTPIEMLTIGANFAMCIPDGADAAWELLWNISVTPTEDIAIYHEGAYRATTELLQAALKFYYTSIYVAAAFEYDLAATTDNFTMGFEAGYDFVFGRLFFTPAVYVVIPAAGDADYGLKLFFLASF